jgi:hypothetical protein
MNISPHGPKSPWTTHENHRLAQRMPAHDGTPKKADQQETTGRHRKQQREPNHKEEVTFHIDPHDTQSLHEDDNALELEGLKGTPHRPDKPKRSPTPHDEGKKPVDTAGGGHCNPYMIKRKTPHDASNKHQLAWGGQTRQDPDNGNCHRKHLQWRQAQAGVCKLLKPKSRTPKESWCNKPLTRWKAAKLQEQWWRQQPDQPLPKPKQPPKLPCEKVHNLKQRQGQDLPGGEKKCQAM